MASTMNVRYDGNSTVTDNVIHQTWHAGDVYEINESDARRLLTNGSFTEVPVAEDNDTEAPVVEEETEDDGEDEPCEEPTKHGYYSNINEPCPSCDEDKWVVPEEEDDSDSDSGNDN